MNNEDEIMRHIDEDNPLNPYVDDDGYRGTGMTKQEWEEAKYDAEED